VYRSETQSWRDKDLRVYPALGNHEFSACLQSAIGSKVLGIALDSDQRLWLESQLSRGLFRRGGSAFDGAFPRQRRPHS
jgi:hypothetical protein